MIKHRAELAAVMRGGVGDAVTAQKTVLVIDADMVFVAEYRHRDLDLALVAAALRHRTLSAALDMLPCSRPVGNARFVATGAIQSYVRIAEAARPH